MNKIFYPELLKLGPWQEFERNTARLLMHAGWRDVRVVGRSGDGGADVLAVAQNDMVWVFQCKFSRNKSPDKTAIQEVRKAGSLYGADGLCVVTSQRSSKSFEAELQRLKGLNLNIMHFGPDRLLKLSEDVGQYIPQRYSLREYQEEALEALYESIIETGKAHLVMATGLGKTVVLAALVENLLSDGLLGEGRVLILAHTLPLVDQLLVNFWRHLPKTIATHRYAAGERPISLDGITFATIQSFSNMTEPPHFDLVVIDEAHHLGSPSYIETIERLASPKVVGATATPWRADGVSISNWIGKPNFVMGIQEGLANGYLSNIDYRIYVDDLDWELVRQSSQFGYTVAQLNKKLIIPMRDEKAVHEIKSVFRKERRKTGIVFSPSQVHARSFASDLRMSGFRAQSLTSDDDTIARYRKLAQFASGKLDILCVVDIFNEGIDVPDVDLLVFLRVTHSRRIFVQQLGRGLRLSPQKDRVVVLDFVADIRRIHAALELRNLPGSNEHIERLLLSNSVITFSNRHMHTFFNHWIADLVNIEDYEEDDLVKLPILDPDRFDFPDTM